MNSAKNRQGENHLGTSWYSGTATQHCTFHGVACMATINYMIHDVRLQIKKYAERISVTWVASFTLTQCHMHCRCFTILSAAYLFNFKKQACSHELCVEWAAHEPGGWMPRRYIMRCTDIMWYNVIVVEWYCLMWGCRWGTLGQKLKLSRFKLCHCACTWVPKVAQQLALMRLPMFTVCAMAMPWCEL